MPSGLESVKARVEEPEIAMKELLTYFRNGNAGKYPLDKKHEKQFIAIIFPQFKDSETWKAEAIRRLNAETAIQIYPDGMQRELSMNYHTHCISWFLRTVGMS
ncbi:MAG: hypothetical protein LBF88_07855 [Planctomycetaceae bacterium]|nr:hypothetical protein [Planctomycetaceae bacterium]